jgi:hypothetical protein
MNKHTMRLAMAAAMALATTAGAQTVTYTLTLEGSQEVPPVITLATGTATVVVNYQTGDIDINGTYSRLSSEQTDAHLHGPAPRGQTASPIVTLTGTGGTSGTFSGSAILTATQMQEVFSNLTYINVHSNLFPNGEIRGQLEKIAKSTVCNGSNVNPIVLTNTSTTAPAPAPTVNAPVINKNWKLTLDCNNPPAPIGRLSVFRVSFSPKPAPMNTKWGQLLVNVSSITGQTFLRVVPASRVVDLGPIFIPNDPGLLDGVFSVQGLCPGSPGYLSNALAETIGGG